MRRVAIGYRDVELEACEQDDVWTVRLANLEARASYLDLALAGLLGDAREGHRAAARLLSELADLVEQQEVGHPQRMPRPRRAEQRSALLHKTWGKPVLLGLRVLVFGVVASTAFILTTWLSTLR
jgi:hypothetical protein